MVKLNFPDESYALQSLPADAQRLVNLYSEPLPEGSPWKSIIRSTPGLVPTFQLGTGPVYQMNDALSGRLYIASGDHFFRLRPDAESPPEDLGYIGPIGVAPTIAVGTNSACVCAPPRAYVCDHSGAMTEITDPAFTQYGASSVAYIDGYFVFTAFENSSRWFCSDLLSGTTFDALNFAYADLRPNVVRRVVAHRGDLFFLGEGGIECWYDAGGTNFPFLRRAGADIAYGCGAPASVAVVDNSIFYLSYLGGIIFRIDGYQAVRISTPAVEEWTRLNSDYARIDACAHTYEGHSWYCLTFNGTTPETRRTFCYDCSTKRWAERASGPGASDVWLGQSAAQRGQVVLIGSRANGQIYNLNPGADTDNGQVLTRIATLPPIWADTDRAFMHRLTLEMQPGIMSGDNRVALEVSDDGGINYRARPDGVTAGVLGDTKHRVAWTRLGSFRQRVVRFRMDGAAALYGADAEMEKGAA